MSVENIDTLHWLHTIIIHTQTEIETELEDDEDDDGVVVVVVGCK